jgi:hypothetical protein
VQWFTEIIHTEKLLDGRHRFSHSALINVYPSSPGRHAPIAVMRDLFHEVGGASYVVSNRVYLIRVQKLI